MMVDLNALLEVRRQFQSYLECFIDNKKGEILKCDFAEDSPYRLKAKTFNEEFKIHIDNIDDLS